MDNQLTNNLQDWLETPAPQRDLIKGAEMLLKLNRNRFLYQNIMRKPSSFSDKLEYELRKYLNIRLDNLTISQVVELDNNIIPSVNEILQKPPVISSEDELPEGQKANGRRDDHDSLPPEIQALWDENIIQYQKIKHTFEQLKSMDTAEPCDRYEYLKILGSADKAYRANLEKYDNFVFYDNNSEKSSDSANQVPVDVIKKVGAARKYISKNKSLLASLVESKDAKADILRAKFQESVNIIQSSGSSLSKSTKDELVNLGINF